MKRFKASIAVLALAVTGCVFGANAAVVPFSRTPAGATVTILTDKGKYTAELVEVRDSGVVLRQPALLLIAPFSTMRRLRADHLGSTYSAIVNGGLTPTMRERFRLVSHYPQGMTPEIEKVMLAQVKQTQLVVVH
jgi:hypothetical protein